MLTPDERNELKSLVNKAHLLRGKVKKRYHDLFEKSLRGVYIRPRITKVIEVESDRGAEMLEVNLECGHFVNVYSSYRMPLSRRMRCPACSASLHRGA